MALSCFVTLKLLSMIRRFGGLRFHPAHGRGEVSADRYGGSDVDACDKAVWMFLGSVQW